MTSGASGTRASKDGGGASSSQNAMSEINDSMKKLVEILENLKEQQQDQRAGRDIKIAAVESLHKVREAMVEAAKSKSKGEEGKMVLPSLKT